MSLDRSAGPSSEPPNRATCYRCFRPQSICYCGSLPELKSRTKICILQHPREEFHPINTARMTELSLRSAEVLRGGLSRLQRELETRDLRGSALVFPSAHAMDLGSPEIRQNPPEELIFLDGTWAQAKQLLSRLPRLRELPHVRFTPEAPSEYRIRKEPRIDYLSTIESVAHALSVLEPDFPAESLREVFRQVIDQNISARPLTGGHERKKLRSARPHRFPEWCAAPQEELLIVYAEGLRTQGQTTPLPLVVCLERFRNAPAEAAVQSSPRATFWLDLGPQALAQSVYPDASFSRLLHRLGSNESDYEAQKLSSAAFLGAFRDWIGSEPASLLAWHTPTAKLLQALGVEAPVAIVKGPYVSYRRFRGDPVDKGGGIEDAIRREEPHFAAPDTKGRAELRLAQTSSLVHYLRSQAQV